MPLFSRIDFNYFETPAQGCEAKGPFSFYLFFGWGLTTKQWVHGTHKRTHAHVHTHTYAHARVQVLCVYVYLLCFGTFRAFSFTQAEVCLPFSKPHPPLHILGPWVSCFFGFVEPLEVFTGVNHKTPRFHCCCFKTLRLPAGPVPQNLYSKFLFLHLDYLKIQGSACSKEFSFVFIFVLLRVWAAALYWLRSGSVGERGIVMWIPWTQCTEEVGI